jgi:hypothetical protein
VAAAFVPVREATPVTDRTPDQNRPPQLLKTSEVARLLGVTPQRSCRGPIAAYSTTPPRPAGSCGSIATKSRRSWRPEEIREEMAMPVTDQKVAVVRALHSEEAGG